MNKVGYGEYCRGECRIQSEVDVTRPTEPPVLCDILELASPIEQPLSDATTPTEDHAYAHDFRGLMFSGSRPLLTDHHTRLQRSTIFR